MGALARLAAMVGPVPATGLEPPGEAARVESADGIRRFVLAGRATFTLRSRPTGMRYTYKVTRADGDAERRPWFVGLLTGPENEASYSYLGTIFVAPHHARPTPRYFHGKKSKVAEDAPGARAIAWYLDQLLGHVDGGKATTQVEFWHAGRCARCGRTLTTPESIATGLGPTCAGKE